MDPLIEIGRPAPDFTLPDLEGKPHSPSELRGRIVLLDFFSAGCTWSDRASRAIAAQLPHWGERLAWLSIAANDNETPEELAQAAAARGIHLVLLDAGQDVADLYGAQTTPHLFLIDPCGILRYMGAFDDVTFRRREPQQAYLFDAVEALLAGRLPDPAHTAAYGCAILRSNP
jgi:peroxiredoxin